MKYLLCLSLLLICFKPGFSQDDWIIREVTITSWGNPRIWFDADVIAYLTDDGKTPDVNGKFVRFINYSNNTFYYQASNPDVYKTRNAPSVRLTIGANTYYDEVQPHADILVNIKEGVYFTKEDMNKPIDLVIYAKYKLIDYERAQESTDQQKELEEARKYFYESNNPCQKLKTTGVMYGYWMAGRDISSSEQEYHYSSEIFGFDGDEKSYSVDDEENLKACVRQKIREAGLPYTDEQITVMVYRKSAGEVEQSIQKSIENIMKYNGQQQGDGQTYRASVKRMSILGK